MGRIFLSAGHNLGKGGVQSDPGAPTVLGTTETNEMIKTRDLLVRELEFRGVKKDQDLFSVPDTIDLKSTLNWINDRARSGDVALELHGNAGPASARGAEIFYIDGNPQRKRDAELILNTLIEAVPGLRSRGAKPDTISQHERGLAFCRQLRISSLLIELCFLSNDEDMKLLNEHRDKFAKGLADGLMKWSNQTGDIPDSFPSIDIEIKGQIHQNKGILVNNNSFIPVDLVAPLSIDLTKLPDARRLKHGNIDYVRAIDLQQLNVSVAWDNQIKRLILN
ncbi:MAG: N-acetylmuramoyl-L-alanine amidase [Mojavia pulchra JT2-VF2]|jgi:N-acetylmuramoyl-L-alanine amidase|uniref:N-acetylmuramoyl-L-alanine amidase n=1 Tax=Mojavia pulchra JT2-VF2 TaxID=287848 RepID=A0A951Q2L3_9NOST|nr:N-acetylmuramoyl-L-alanine amidase [Mojavia pulchra JT2-VF2]